MSFWLKSLLDSSELYTPPPSRHTSYMGGTKIFVRQNTVFSCLRRFQSITTERDVKKNYNYVRECKHSEDQVLI